MCVIALCILNYVFPLQSPTILYHIVDKKFKKHTKRSIVMKYNRAIILLFSSACANILRTQNPQKRKAVEDLMLGQL